MGCVPSQRKPSIVAASMPVKKGESSKRLESKRNSSNSLDNNNLRTSTESAPYFQVRQSKHKREESDPSSPKFNIGKTDTKQTYVYNRNSKPTERETIRVLPPAKPNHPSKQTKNKPQQLSKLVSIHSLDLNSRIKAPEMKTPKPQKKEKISQPYCEDVNITFNNNNFATHNSAARPLDMGRRWREETLRQELKGINEEHFRKIAVEAMPFN